MSIRNRLFKFIFFRSLFTIFGNRTSYSAKTKDFAAYFQYKIGAYQPDLYLYFPKQPYLQVYKNEIFNRMHEYEGYDLIRNSKLTMKLMKTRLILSGFCVMKPRTD